MNTQIAVVADSDTVTGFRLAGIKEGHAVETPEEAEKIIRDLIKKEVSIIIVTEKIGDEIREFIDEATGSRALPIIIEIPDKYGPSEERVEPLRELIKRVIGIELVK